MQTFHGHDTFGDQNIGNNMKLALRWGGFISSIPCGRNSDARSSAFFPPPSAFFPPLPAPLLPLPFPF